MNMAIAGLLGILLISAVIAWWLVRQKPQERPVKIMMFVGYFWLSTFLQLLLAVLLYFGWQRFFLS
jgi:hypothetical protein